MELCEMMYGTQLTVAPSSPCTWAEVGLTSLPVAGRSRLSVVLPVLRGQWSRGLTLKTQGHSDMGH